MVILNCYTDHPTTIFISMEASDCSQTDFYNLRSGDTVTLQRPWRLLTLPDGSEGILCSDINFCSNVNKSE